MVKRITRIIMVLLLLVVAAVLAALIWLRQDVHSFEWARPHITRALNPPDAPYVVNYAKISVDWRNWSQLGLIEIQSIVLTGRDGTILASLPKAYISFNPFGILTGGRMVNTVLLHKPKILLSRDADKVIRIGLESDNASIPLTSLISASNDSSLPSANALPFRKLVIDRAVFSFTDRIHDVNVSSARATLRLVSRGSKVDASVNLPFVYNKKSGNIDASIRSFSSDGSHVFNVSLHQFPAQLTCIVIECGDGVDASGLVSGKLSVGLDEEHIPTSAEVNLTASNAVFTAPKIFAEPFVVAKGLIQLKASQAMRLIHLSRLSLLAEDTAFEISGTGRRDDAGWHVDASAKATKPIAVSKIYKYWPLPLAPDSRAWVLGAMKAGSAEGLYLNLTLSPDDFKAEYVSDAAVDAGLIARDLTTEYLPGFPHLRNVVAKAHFTGTTATIDATAGTTLTGTQIQHAVVLFPDLNKLGTPVEIVANLNAPAADVATLLALKPFTFDDALALDSASLSGSVDAMLSLKFNAFSGDLAPQNATQSNEVDFSNVIYTISTQLTNVAQKKLGRKIDVSAINGALNATNAGMNFDGSVLFADANRLKLNVAQLSGEHVSIDANGTIGRAQFISLGVPDSGYLGDGSATVSAQLVAQKNGVIVKNVQVDFTDMAVAIPELSWSKNRSAAGKFSMASTISDDKKDSGYVGKIIAADLDVPEFSITFDAKQQLKTISLPSVVTSRDRFAASYRARADGFDVGISGKRLDMSDLFSKPGDGTLKNFPPIGLTLDLAELVLVKEAPFTKVKGNLLCNRQRCDKATLHAAIGKNTVDASIASKAGIRQLLITASDAGDFLRAIGFTDRMYRGRMEIKGTYDDHSANPIFVGSASIRDFTLKNSAILGRIFSIGSLTGLQNALTGSGIAFDKLVADIQHQSGIINISNGKANGNAMGITVGGAIDTTAAKLNLKGVVVPAYAINSLVGKIPLIGAIAGGDGEGLIAFNYQVGGTYSQPDVSVNALSGLTPGFLRGIFSIFDGKEKKSGKPPTENSIPAESL